MIANIQGLRALAAAMVVLHHLGLLVATAGFDAHVVDFGALGVDIFFVISGFVMQHMANRKPQTARVFLLHRIVRVVPLYWVVTMSTFIVALLEPTLMGGTRANWMALVKSLFFIPYLRGDGTVRPILFVGWSLNFEMMFYLIFAVSMAIVAQRRVLPLTVGVLLAMVAAHTYFGTTAPLPIRFLTRPLILEFGVGMLLAQAYTRMTISPAVAWGGLLVGGAGLLYSPFVHIGHDVPAGALPAVLIVGSALALEKSGRAIGLGFPVLLGNSSYALYLVHPFITQSIIKLAVSGELVNRWTLLPLMALVLVLSIAAGILMHLAVEIPINNRLRQRGGEGSLVVASSDKESSTPEQGSRMKP